MSVRSQTNETPPEGAIEIQALGRNSSASWDLAAGRHIASVNEPPAATNARRVSLISGADFTRALRSRLDLAERVGFEPTKGF